MSRRLSTLVGFLAVLIWAFLALLTAASGPVPPFELAAITFTLGGGLGATTWLFRKGASANLKQDWRIWLIGSAGLCLYHCCYFYAIQTAPPLEVSLLSYLWPLLLVVFASFLPGEKLRPHHLFGVVLGLSGAALMITKGGEVALANGLTTGHGAALASAFIWALYSVMARRYGAVPTDIVVGYCLITAFVTLFLHFIFEQTVWPTSAIQAAAIALLGLFPLGAAFYAWDHGMKHGDIMVIGALAYTAPLQSALILLAAGYGQYHWSVAVACLLITGGALIAAKDLFLNRRQKSEAAV